MPPDLAGSEKVPAVPGHVEEHGDTPVRLVARLGDELDAGLAHPVVRRPEVVDPQEHPDTARELVSHAPRLPLAVGPREQQRGSGTGRAHDDPALGTPVVGDCGRVLDELEAEGVDEEPDRCVVVVDDESDLLQIHRRPIPREGRPRR